jgi:hypothetical protein
LRNDVEKDPLMAKAALASSLLLALGVIAAPLAASSASAASEPAASGRDYYTKQICETVRPVGSRLGGTRRCRTQAEIDQHRRENRQVLDRIQAHSPSLCPPQPWLC